MTELNFQRLTVAFVAPWLVGVLAVVTLWLPSAHKTPMDTFYAAWPNDPACH